MQLNKALRFCGLLAIKSSGLWDAMKPRGIGSLQKIGAVATFCDQMNRSSFPGGFLRPLKAAF